MLKIKNKRLFKAVFSVFMVVVICLATMGSVPIKVYSAYIDPALEKVLSRAADTDLIPVDIWLYDIDTDAVDAKVKAKTGLSKASLVNEKTAAELTHAEVDAYIEAERTLYAEAQTKRSNEFLKQYANIFTSKATENSDVFYVSKYAPSIQMELTPDQIAKLAKDLSVESIYYLPEVEFQNNFNISIEETGAKSVRDYLGYTGNGIKIGIIELEVPDRTKSYFTSSNIIYDPNVDVSIDQNIAEEATNQTHAEFVAFIMVGKETTIDGVTYKGITPNAMLYATKLDTNYVYDMKSRIEWLLTQGVNVVNMSLGISNTDGNYTSYERWFDHIAINHSIHFVVSAGNDYDYICRPGLAYNVITVGNYNDNNTTTDSDDSLAGDSSFYEDEPGIEKPDIIAPGTNITTPLGTWSGTSFSAPHVSAIIAQLCQAKPALKTLQDTVKAIITASISHERYSYATSTSQDMVVYNLYGAGAIDANSSYYTAINTSYVSSNFAANSAVGTSRSHYFTINSTQTVMRISLAWLNYVNISSSHSTATPAAEDSVADLELRILDSSGKLLASADLGGNVEIVKLTNLRAGTYTMQVVVKNTAVRKIYYSLAWR